MSQCKIDVETKVQKCCDSEWARHMLGCVRCHAATEPGKVWLTASNGRVLVAVQSDGETPVPELVPAKAFPTTKKGTVERTNGEWRNSQGKVHPLAPDGRFPDATQVLPDVSDCRAVTMDPRLIHALGLALQDQYNPEGLTFFIPDDQEGAIGVVGQHGVGVIMPMTREDSKATETYTTRVEDFTSSYKGGDK